MKKLTSLTFFLSSFVILLLLSQIAYSQETGSVSGVVKDEEGQLLENATVKILGVFLPDGRQMVTKSDGEFRFLYLPPGKYTIDATHPDKLDMALEVDVQLNRDTHVPVIMYSSIQEEMKITAIAPLVDIKHTEISTNWFQEEFRGKKLFDEGGSLVSITVTKAGQEADEEHSVDGISGGTITSKGLEKMLLDDFTGYKEFLIKKKS